ncbi:hypothetical protein ES703_98931 [subsurface metagenome]
MVERGGQLAHFILSLHRNILTEIARVGNRPGSFRQVLNGTGNTPHNQDGDNHRHPDGSQQDTRRDESNHVNRGKGFGLFLLYHNAPASFPSHWTV